MPGFDMFNNNYMILYILNLMVKTGINRVPDYISGNLFYYNMGYKNYV